MTVYGEPQIDSSGGVSSAVYLRARLVEQLRGGAAPGTGQGGTPLSPLCGIPCTAMMTYLLFEHDESMLAELYPALRERVLKLFESDDAPDGGLVAGLLPGMQSGENDLSPAVNALADLELHALSLIAERIGRYEEALELITWSRKQSTLVTRAFYDPAREGFFPVSRSGRFRIRSEPYGLLPLLLDREIGTAMRKRIVAGSIRLAREGNGAGAAGETLTPSLDPDVRLFLHDLLGTLPSLDGDLLDLLDPLPHEIGSGSDGITPAAHWTEFWRRNPKVTARLFPPRNAVLGLIVLSKICVRESLINPGDDRRFAGEVDSLERALSEDSADIAAHQWRIATVNRLLASMSNLLEYLEADSRLWKVIDETRWRTLSPRTRKLFVASCRLAVDELLYAKILLSETFTRSTGIIAEADFPDAPVPLGTVVEIDASISSRIDSLEISSVYAQIGENRCCLAGEQERVPLAPWTNALAGRCRLIVHPGTEPGLLSVPVLFDFKYEGSRVEIHHRASVDFVRGHEASIRFPEGRVLGNGPLPVTIVLHYRPEHDVQGTLEGTFLREIRSNPVLPARFAVNAARGVTVLPIEISCAAQAPPGVYPLAFSLELGGEPIAVFDETVVRPLRWLYIGALPRNGITFENAPYYVDNLFEEHPTEDGRMVRWRELPDAAVDGDGRIVPDRIPGAAANSSLLLYTMIDAPIALKAIWRLDTENAASVWINGDLVSAADRSGDGERSGPIALREGANAVLVAVRGNGPFAPVSFRLADGSGLPVPGIGNDFERLIDGYYRLAGAGVASREAEIQRVEVTFTLHYPSAAEVCVVGTFNNWEAGANPMRRGANGTWSVNVPLPAGRYAYKFLIDRSSKIADPGSGRIEPDGFGGFNSVLLVP